MPCQTLQFKFTLFAVTTGSTSPWYIRTHGFRTNEVQGREGIDSCLQCLAGELWSINSLTKTASDQVPGSKLALQQNQLV
jgi:hypothetical protein